MTDDEKALRRSLESQSDAVPVMVSAIALRGLLAEVERLRGALESIREYWNGDSNETATLDAIRHAVETAIAALENADAPR